MPRFLVVHWKMRLLPLIVIDAHSNILYFAADVGNSESGTNPDAGPGATLKLGHKPGRDHESGSNSNSSFFHVGAVGPLRISYRLSQFVVDAASSWSRPFYPGLIREWARSTSKKSSFAAAWARVWPRAAILRYQEKYRSRYFVATPRNRRSQIRKSYNMRRAFLTW